MQYATTVLGILFLTFLMSTYFYVFIVFVSHKESIFCVNYRLQDGLYNTIRKPKAI